MVSFDGHQHLIVDLEPLSDNIRVHRASEVDDISLRMRTNRSSAYLMTSSSRHVTSDLLTVALNDGRITVDISTADDHKVFYVNYCRLNILGTPTYAISAVAELVVVSEKLNISVSQS